MSIEPDKVPESSVIAPAAPPVNVPLQRIPGVVILGVCAMEKKAKSKPMTAILRNLRNTGQFQIVHFEESVILNSPVEDWPYPLDALISFYSDGFPLSKAEAYVALRQPHCINEITAQRILLDRRRVYALLQENDVPCPDTVVIERDPATGELVGAAAETFVEADDYIQVGEKRLDKPFVEKPIDSENHNICIYYPSSAGGGVKSLFRKVGDKSSSYDPSTNSIRRDGTYMYEPFFQTGGTDIKVYTIGPEYAHAEARKSPVIDGLVNRDKNGKEVRVPVVLTLTEKEIARRVCLAFGQTVCGFDLLRTPTKSYVIDVNGWSFVKGVDKYYEDAAAVLCNHMLRVTNTTRVVNRTSKSNAVAPSDAEPNTKEPNEKPPASLGRWENQELLAVLAIMRHGDRTPKNKMKLLTQREEIIALHKRWAKDLKKEAKLKAPKQLQEVLDISAKILSAGSSNDSETGIDDDEDEDGSGSEYKPEALMKSWTKKVLSIDEKETESFQLIKDVLSKGHRFDGINRKVQLKPTQWNEAGEVTEIMIVLKYGGTLTPAGVAQAEQLGHRFRYEMYPGECTDCDAIGFAPAKKDQGLLRLHATQRHDFKVYSSDEGRVQLSAAAFTRGLLDLEGGELTPICVALVETDSKMLDELQPEAGELMNEAKARLNARIVAAMQTTEAPQSSAETPHDLPGLADRISDVIKELQQTNLQAAIMTGCGPRKVSSASTGEALTGAARDPAESTEVRTCCSSTKPLLVLRRWQKLRDDLRNEKKGTWDLSKVPEICDAVKYDMIHCRGLAKSFDALYDVAKRLNDVIVPWEYGMDDQSRADIGARVCGPLVKKLLNDLQSSAKRGPKVEEWNMVTAVQFLKRKLMGDGSRASKKDDRVSMGRVDSAEKLEEAEFARLNPEHGDHLVNPHRRVRTRLYFTSESHIQAMMSVLRHCHSHKPNPLQPRAKSGTDLVSLAEFITLDGEHEEEPISPKKKEKDTLPRIVCVEAEARLRAEPVFDYLTQIVFRLYEDKLAPSNSPERYRVEVLFSPGANDHPSAATDGTHTMPLKRLVSLHREGEPLSLDAMAKLLTPFLSSSTAMSSPTHS